MVDTWKNVNKVPNKVWRLWGKEVRVIFNENYAFFKNNQKIMTHPKAKKMPSIHWETLSWNSAWITAFTIQGLLQFIKGKGKK